MRRRCMDAAGGAAAWQKTSGYTKRSPAEVAIGRLRQVTGDGRRSPMDERRTTEVDIAVHLLNRVPSRLARLGTAAGHLCGKPRKPA